MIFGRAGEEMAELQREGIPVEIVPGISTAFALAAELKVSLTHRDHAQSVRVVTAHARDGKLPTSLDWQALSDPATTHVYYMVGRTAGQLAARLLEAGMSPKTPVLLACNVGRKDHTDHRGVLRDLAVLATAVDLKKPIILIVGRVLNQAGTSVACQGATLAAPPASQ